MGSSGAGMSGAEPAPDAWSRVHWITPLLEVWQLLVVLVVGFVFGGLDEITTLSASTAPITPAKILLVVLGVVLGVAAVVGAYSFFAWRARAYALTDDAVWTRFGILFRRVKHVPLEKVQAVDVIRPFMGRVFGLGRLSVEAAGGVGSSIAIGYLREADLLDLRADILARASGAKMEAAGTAPPQAQDQGQAQIQIQIREQDHDAALTSPIPPAQEKPLYSVGAGRLLGAAATTTAFLTAALMAVVASVAAAVIAGFAVELGMVVFFTFAAPTFVIAASVLWSRFAWEFGFTVAVSPEGIRVRKGLLETRSEAIPPHRVHAVLVTQPLLWRPFGWYRVKISQATGRAPQSGGQQVSSILLPVGTKEQALLATGLVIPSLGVEDPHAFFGEALDGNRRAQPFLGIPKRALIFDPLVGRRRSVALTETCIATRDGFFTRTATFVPYQRIQSMVAQRGPLQGLLNLVSVTTCIVPGVVRQVIHHLDTQVASQVMEQAGARSHTSRASEPPERWLARVREAAEEEDPTPPATPTSRFAPPDAVLVIQSTGEDTERVESR